MIVESTSLAKYCSLRDRRVLATRREQVTHFQEFIHSKLKLLLMTDHARKFRVSQDSRFHCFVCRIEQRDVALRLLDTIVEHSLVLPARILFREPCVCVDLLRALPVAPLDHHVAHIQKETFEVMRSNPGIPSALLAFSDFPDHVLRVIRVCTVDLSFDAFVQSAHSAFIRSREARSGKPRIKKNVSASSTERNGPRIVIPISSCAGTDLERNISKNSERLPGLVL